MNFSLPSYWPIILLALALAALAFVNRANIGSAIDSAVAKVKGMNGGARIAGELATFEQDWSGMAAALAPHFKALETNVVDAVHSALGKAPAAPAPAAQAAPPVATEASTTPADSGGTPPASPVAAVAAPAVDEVAAAHAALDSAIARAQAQLEQAKAAKDTLTAAQAAIAQATAAANATASMPPAASTNPA